MQAKKPIAASEIVIAAGVDENAAMKAPAAPPMKQIPRARRLLKWSENNPQGRASSPNIRYIGNPNCRTSFNSICKESTRGMARAGKAIS